jgi:uncharacterized damage-inducible protein DinB
MGKSFRITLAILTGLSSIFTFAQKSNKNIDVQKNLPLSSDERLFMVKELTLTMNNFKNSIEVLSFEQFSFQPHEKSWSIAQVIEHITLAELEFQNILDRALQQPADSVKRKKIKIDDDEIYLKMTAKNWKAKSPKIFKPSNSFESVESSLEAFNSQRSRTIKYIERTQNDLRNRFWKHPLTGTIDLYQTLLLMSAHLQRHVEQIHQIKNNSNFPKI